MVKSAQLPVAIQANGALVNLSALIQGPSSILSQTPVQELVSVGGDGKTITILSGPDTTHIAPGNIFFCAGFTHPVTVQSITSPTVFVVTPATGTPPVGGTNAYLIPPATTTIGLHLVKEPIQPSYTIDPTFLQSIESDFVGYTNPTFTFPSPGNTPDAYGNQVSRASAQTWVCVDDTMPQCVYGFYTTDTHGNVLFVGSIPAAPMVAAGNRLTLIPVLSYPTLLPWEAIIG